MDIRWIWENNQAVLLPAFMAAYSGSDAAGFLRGFCVPIPNWAVKYNGLMRYDLFKGILNDFLAT
jgi:cell surface protein SprA